MVILGFLTIPWLGPKDTELRAPSVPKAKLGHTELCALSGYVTPSNSYIGFPYYPLVRPKTHGTACDISPKGEARTHGTACAIGPKGEARTHGTACNIGPKGEAKTHRTACDIGPKGEARTHRTACDIGFICFQTGPVLVLTVF